MPLMKPQEMLPMQARVQAGHSDILRAAASFAVPDPEGTSSAQVSMNACIYVYTDIFQNLTQDTTENTYTIPRTVYMALHTYTCTYKCVPYTYMFMLVSTYTYRKNLYICTNIYA